MSTQFHYFQGVAYWAKLRTPDNKFGEDKYKMDFYPDDPDAFKALGLELKERSNEHGTYYALSRPNKKLIKNELVEFGAPKIYDGSKATVDADGKVISYEELPENVEIGNGSKVTVKLVTYNTLKGKGHRLESVRVDDLIEFHRNKEGF